MLASADLMSPGFQMWSYLICVSVILPPSTLQTKVLLDKKSPTWYSTIKVTIPACVIKNSSVLASCSTSRVTSSESSSAARGTRWPYKGSAILPSASHQGDSLLALWHNWQTVWCHLTPLFQCSLFPSSLVKRKARRARESLSVAGWAHWTVRLKELLHTELHISGSGSANVGDGGIGGLKPSLSAFA